MDCAKLEQIPCQHMRETTHMDRSLDEITQRAIHEVDKLTVFNKSGDFRTTSKAAQPKERYTTTLNDITLIFLNRFDPKLLTASNSGFIDAICESTRLHKNEPVYSKGLRFSIYPDQKAMCFSSYQMEHQDMYETMKREDGFNDQDFFNSCRGYINNGAMTEWKNG